MPMKTISYTYRCGHIKIIKYPPSQQQVAKKPTTTKSSSRRHFSYFKCKQHKQQTTSNYCNEISKETEERKINTAQGKRNPKTKSRLTIYQTTTAMFDRRKDNQGVWTPTCFKNYHPTIFQQILEEGAPQLQSNNNEVNIESDSDDISELTILLDTENKTWYTIIPHHGGWQFNKNRRATKFATRETKN